MHITPLSQLIRRSACLLTLGGLLFPALFLAQQPPATTPPAPGNTPQGTNPPEPEQKRIFGIIPNYRTFPSLTRYQPLSPGQKFKIASQDSFDRGTFVLAAAFAGEGQLTNSNPAFGDGAAAYARYLGTSYADSTRRSSTRTRATSGAAPAPRYLGPATPSASSSGRIPIRAACNSMPRRW